MIERSEYRLLQSGLQVAKIDMPAADDAEREIMRYAMQYAQDGMVTVQVKKGRRWKDVCTIGGCF
jgi:hypothetical protein